jgi:hypothetical protein
MDIRPRTTGEILDDAWRLALADAPLLLALSGLFLAPAILVLLLLLTKAPPGNQLPGFVLPTLLALFWPLTGIGSGACQVAFRRRAEGEVVTLHGCLGEALRRGLDHTTLRAVVLVFGLLGSLFLLLPGLGLWIAAATAHPILAAGKVRWLPALGAACLESQRQPAKSAGVVLSRLMLLLLAALNLHGFLQVGLWIGDHLAGLDLALADLVLELNNPVYDLCLVLLAWLLLAPYAEASNYLLHVDARARYEGLDLWYRVRRLFPVGAKSVATSAGLILLALLVGTSPAKAADARLATVRQAREDIKKITTEVKAAEPYPGGERWEDRLEEIAERLDRQASRQRGRFRWFAQEIPGFLKANRAGALGILGNLDRRLALLEESLSVPEPPANSGGVTKDQLRALLPPDVDDDRKPEKKPEPKEKERPKAKEEDQPVRRVDPARERPPPQPRPTPAPSASSGEGLGSMQWLLLVVAAVVVVLLAVFLNRRERKATAPKVETAKPPAKELSLESLLSQPTRVLENLWQQADDLARAGQCLEAVRTLYLAVLMLLHRSGLIRCAPMRTNGEYVRQVRSKEEVYRPFRGLTGLFEVKWYGERACQPADYDTCRRLAESVREGVTAE